MWRVLDTNLSAHSVLRDRYHRRETGVTLLIVALSVAATTLPFVSGEVTVEVWRIRGRLGIFSGFLTALIFFLALVDLTVDWRRRAWEHSDAARRLADLKARFRAVTPVSDGVDAGGIDLRALYEETMARVREIPDNQFLAMKARHHRKVAVSKLIDTHKGAPLVYVRLLAVVQGLRESPSRGSKATESVEEPPA
jgi:hypothetical protein